MLVDLPNWVGDQLIVMPTVIRLAAEATAPVLHARAATRRLWQQVLPGARVAAGERRADPVSAARRLRTSYGRFDLAVTLRHSSRAKILVRLVAQRAVGSAGRGAALLLDHRYRVDRSRHQLFDAAGLLRLWQLPPVDAAWRLRLPGEMVADGARRLAVAAPAADRRLVGLAPATGCGEAKRWSAERFGALAARLDDRGWRCVVLIGPGETLLAEELCRAAGRALPVLGADDDVAGLAGLIANLDLVVANDSGPMHLAAFLDVPVVAVFGPTDPGRTGPVGEGHRVVATALECAPCRRERCPLGHRRCLEGLEVEDVVAAVAEAVPPALTARPA